MKQADDSWLSPKEMNTRDLVAAIALYNFRDEHGHPLGNCVEYAEVVTRAQLVEPNAGGNQPQPHD